MTPNFRVEALDPSCKGRTGVFQVCTFTIPTPICWLGQSLRSKLRLSDVLQAADFPLMITAGDILGRDYLLKDVTSFGIHSYLSHAGPILADSGGFKFMSQSQVPISVSRLVEFYESARVEIGVSLDHPLSLSVAGSTNRRRWQRTLRNFEKALQIGSSVPIMPVVHGYSLSDLCVACKRVRSLIERPAAIGLGSLVPLLSSFSEGRRFRYKTRDGRSGNQLEFIADAISLVRSFFPESLLHVFGVGGPTSILPLYALGVDSVDSVGWRITASYGRIMLPGTSDRTLSDKPNSHRSKRSLDAVERELLRQCQCPICQTAGSLEDRMRILASSFRARAIHNAAVVVREVSNFREAMVRGEGAKYLGKALRPHHNMYPVMRHEWSTAIESGYQLSLF